MSARFIIGDTREVTATLPDGSIDFIMTSPPFLALRSYLPADHPAKHLEIGSEPDPATFLDVLLDLTAEWSRVLAPHGSICVELGDTYSGAGGYGSPDSPNPAYGKTAHNARFEGRTARRYKTKDDGWPLAKSLCGIPHLYHLSLAYGRNLLTGEPSPAGQWRVRNVVAWCRPNPPVGALGDKFRPATSYLTIATKARDRYFDLDAVRGERSPNTHARTARGVEVKLRTGKSADRDGNFDTLAELHETAGAPPLDHWTIPTKPYAGAHYAAYPEALCEIPIKSMVPRRVCTICGEPSRRIVNAEYEHLQTTNGVTERGITDGVHGGGGDPTFVHGRARKITTTTGWTDCGHNSWRNGRVLDPFAGTGTTLAVATGHGHDAIGIDLDRRNLALALDRVGPLLLAEATAPDLPGLLGTTEGAAA